MPFGEYRPKDFKVDVWRRMTVTPVRVTSAGSSPWACATRFWTLTVAISGSVPCLKNTLMRAEPLFDALEVM